MPIENEVKYVLRLECEHDVIAVAETACDIKQGYLDDGVRVRSKKWYCPQNKTLGGVEYEYTYKRKIKQGMFEVNCDITERRVQGTLEADGRAAGEDSVQSSLRLGDRFLPGGEEDVLRPGRALEMPKGTKKPHYIPAYIQRLMLDKKPYRCATYSSKALSNPEYAKKKLKKLLRNKTCY
jgi:hypothetical protein